VINSSKYFVVLLSATSVSPTPFPHAYLTFTVLGLLLIRMYVILYLGLVRSLLNALTCFMALTYLSIISM